jgi:hypothetical protein
VYTTAHKAFVLRIDNVHKAHVSLFDSELGHIKVRLADSYRKRELVQGALIEYRLEKSRYGYLCYDSKILLFPTDWVLKDIVFLHHVLEIYLYFSPVNNSCSALFEHGMLLFTISEFSADIRMMKKLFICRLFTLMSVYPQQITEVNVDFFLLLSGPIDIMLNIQYDDKLLAQFAAWIRSCCMTHPQVLLFKTKTFFEKYG